MAGINDLTIKIAAEITVDDKTADTCCNLLHLYCNAHDCNSDCTFYASGEDYEFCNFKSKNVNGNRVSAEYKE